MPDSSRTLVAALVAPLVPVLVFAALGLGAAVVAGIFSYIVFLVLGLPAISALRRFGKLTFPTLILSGAIIGAGSFLCFGIGLARLLGSPATGALDLSTIAWGAGLGGLVAGAFGAIAGLHNLRTAHDA